MGFGHSESQHIIPPPSVFRFTFIFSNYSKYLYSHLLHIIRILSFVPRFFYNNFILKHLRNVPFEFLPPRSRYFHVSISPNAYLKIKSSHQKFVLCDNTLARYNLTIHAVWSLLPYSQHKIDLARVLVTTKSN
jgi:hypothetical protein